MNPLLNQSAQFKAQDMVDRSYFAHTDPSTGKNNGLDYAMNIGSRCVWISENFYHGGGDNATTAGAINWWMQSKSHHDAILDPRYESTGFGVAYTNEDTPVSVQHFCDEQ